MLVLDCSQKCTTDRCRDRWKVAPASLEQRRSAASNPLHCHRHPEHQPDTKLPFTRLPDHERYCIATDDRQRPAPSAVTSWARSMPRCHQASWPLYWDLLCYATYTYTHRHGCCRGTKIAGSSQELPRPQSSAANGCKPEQRRQAAAA